MNEEIFSSLFNETCDRRNFLKKSLFGFAFITFGSSFTSGCSSYPSVQKQLKVFNNKEITVLNAICEAFVSSGETGLPEPEKLGLVYDIDQFISTVSKESQKQLKVLLNVFEDFTLFFDGSLTKFTKMSVEQRQKYLASWENSNLEFRQMAFSALKMFIMLVYYTKDDVWEKIGYSGANCLGGIS